MSVKDKRIVVTGGARGIGARLVGELRERGADVVSTDILPGCDIVCDVSDEQDVIALFNEAGDIDGLVNNAAMLVGRRPFQEISIDEWDRMMAVNVRGTFLCAREASKHMPNGGSIVNVSSTTALSGSQGFLHYVASKGAVISMTKIHGVRARPETDPRQLRRARVHADGRVCRARRLRPNREPRSVASWSPTTCSAPTATCSATIRSSSAPN